MHPAINPELERIRAESMIRSLTEQENVEEMFSLMRTQSQTAQPAARANRNIGRSIIAFFKSIRLKNPVVLPNLLGTQAECETC